MSNPRLPKTNNALRLVTYNVLNGGIGRADPLFETLVWLDGDIVGLTEADDPDLVDYWADKLGYHSATAEDDRHSIALLSRYPIRAAINLKASCEELDRTAIEARVQVGPGDACLRVLVLHLKAGIRIKHEQRRMVELTALQQWIESQPRPAILMGDLNSNAPYHPTDPAAAREKTQRKLAEQHGEIPYLVIPALQELGWIDAHRRCRPDDPRHSLSTGYPAQRVDYIFTDGELADRLQDAAVEQSGFTPYCSDHYPLWADLALPLQ